MASIQENIRQILMRLYGAEKASWALEKILRLVQKHQIPQIERRDLFSQQNIVLITYGDSLKQPGCAPLSALDEFISRHLQDVFTAIHILPFFPFSSDDGFSVTDFYSVDSRLGCWNQIEAIGKRFHLMADLVLNHVSAQSSWFKKYLASVPGFESIAIEADPQADLSMATRPRSLPLLTAFQKASGDWVHVWTTFSEDQIDLNYKSLDVLEKMVAVMLYYLSKGVSILRLDAVAYLWKEAGTGCIHLPQTHDMVKLLRKILDLVAPNSVLITETNVPHLENVSYFGNGYDEAQMVYNFTLPPLLLHAFASMDSRLLGKWVQSLALPSPATAFYNFTASHDGIGVRPLEGIVSKEVLEKLTQRVQENGGFVSYRSNPDGSESPYELNITYLDALKEPSDDEAQHIQKFLASQAIALSLPGIPAIYIHSLLGSRNWNAGVAMTNRARTINREKLRADIVEEELKNPCSFRSKIFWPYISMIRIRRKQPAFHAHARCKVIAFSPQIFALERSCLDQKILSMTNLSDQPTKAFIKNHIKADAIDLITGEAIDSDSIILKPYQYLWISDRGPAQ